MPDRVNGSVMSTLAGDPQQGLGQEDGESDNFRYSNLLCAVGPLAIRIIDIITVPENRRRC